MKTYAVTVPMTQPTEPNDFLGLINDREFGQFPAYSLQIVALAYHVTLHLETWVFEVCDDEPINQTLQACDFNKLPVLPEQLESVPEGFDGIKFSLGIEDTRDYSGYVFTMVSVILWLLVFCGMLIYLTRG